MKLNALLFVAAALLSGCAEVPNTTTVISYDAAGRQIGKCVVERTGFGTGVGNCMGYANGQIGVPAVAQSRAAAEQFGSECASDDGCQSAFKCIKNRGQEKGVCVKIP